MTDSSDSEADKKRRAGAPFTKDALAPNAQSSIHALAERLTTMLNYFAVARGNVAKGEYGAAEEAITRFLDQNDRAREIAEQLRTIMSNRQP